MFLYIGVVGNNQKSLFFHGEHFFKKEAVFWGVMNIIYELLKKHD